MINTIFNLPVPSTALLGGGVIFKELLGQVCLLRVNYEDTDNSIMQLDMLFEDVEIYKCTYHLACTVEMIDVAYNKIVNIENSEWLRDIKDRLLRYQDVKEFKHLITYFDEGPCYEFICKSFKTQETKYSLKDYQRMEEESRQQLKSYRLQSDK